MPELQQRRVRLVEGVRATDQRPETYPPGRVCAAGGCSALLSIYNGSRKCWQCRSSKRKLGRVECAEELVELMQEMGIG